MQKIKEKFKEHWIIYTIILIPIIIFVAFVLYITVIFGIIQYYGGQKNDGESQRLESLILSTKGLPVPKTDVPVILPPDPGEVGKKTLAGIDSNYDGVRDDLEREIVYMYPQNEEVRKILRAEVKKIQDVIATTGDHDHFKGLLESAFAFSNCYIYKVFPVNTYDPTNEQILWHMAVNTQAREKAKEANEAKATPFSSIAGGSSESCKIVKGQY